MGHEYEAQPSVEPEKEEASFSLDSDSEIRVEKQDNEAGTEQTGKVDVFEKGDIVEERDELLPPKVDSENVTLKEGVSKQIIKEGHGLGPPPRHSSCFGTPHTSRNVASLSFGR